MKDEIDEAREMVRKTERNIEAQRWRVDALNGNEAAKWIAEQLLAGSEEALRHHQEHLDELLHEAERRSGEGEQKD